jgi:hypothetical protein
MCNRVAHLKKAASKEIRMLIDRPHEDNLPVQPVAQLLAVESLKEPVVVACGGANLLQRERLCRGR